MYGVIGHRKNLIEIATLVIVEREIEERALVHTHGVDEARLIETHIGGAAPVELMSIGL